MATRRDGLTDHWDSASIESIEIWENTIDLNSLEPITCNPKIHTLDGKSLKMFAYGEQEIP